MPTATNTKALPEIITEEERPTPNVIVFGETGVGKSSVINMLVKVHPDDEAAVSNQATGMTFSNTRHERVIDGQKFNIFDTVGLNEGETGTVPAKEAIASLYHLMRGLQGGVNLLVYIMRAPRIKETAQKNYQLFYNIFCRSKVPIVMIVTGLEDEEPMDMWWITNQDQFTKSNMVFSAVACITASRGKFKNERYVYEEEYDQSKSRVENLIRTNACSDAWKMPMRSWFIHVLQSLGDLTAGFFGLQPQVMASVIVEAIKTFGSDETEVENARERRADIHKLRRTASSRDTGPKSPNPYNNSIL